MHEPTTNGCRMPSVSVDLPVEDTLKAEEDEVVSLMAEVVDADSCDKRRITKKWLCNLSQVDPIGS